MTNGSGWLVVDGVETLVAAGDSVGVTEEHERWFRASDEGCTVIAVCA